jgi:hypothetical protein
MMLDHDAVPRADRFDNSLIIGYTSMVLAFLMIFAGIKSYRDNVADGTVSFGRALVIGLLITLVASACYVATWEDLFPSRCSRLHGQVHRVCSGKGTGVGRE